MKNAIRSALVIFAVLLGGVACTGPSYTGTVSRVGAQGTSARYTVQLQGESSARWCDSYKELNCAILRPGDHISYHLFNDEMLDIRFASIG